MDSSTAILVAGAAILVAAGVVAWSFLRKRRTEMLRGRFGPEYDRAVAAAGDPRRAEARLADRTRRVKKLELRAVPDAERARFAGKAVRKSSGSAMRSEAARWAAPSSRAAATSRPDG